MRKIISILVALGLVLALSTMVVPTAGAACTAEVVLSNYCAAKTGVTYTINFTSPVTLLPGNDKLSVDFADGTGLGSVTKTDVTVEDVTDTDSGTPTAITVSGTHIEFAVPAATLTIEAGHEVKITINKVSNPATGGAKILNLDYQLVCCPAVVFDCATYTIKPAKSTYSFMLDFDPTYPGIAEDFVPPFKACGQADNVTGEEDFDTVYYAPNWYTQFDIVLVEEVEGCAPACVNATLSFNVTAFPTPSTGAVVSLNISGEFFALTPTASGDTLTANITLTPGSNITFPSLLHFNKIGEYEICFDITCPGDPAGTCPECLPATGPVSIVDGPVCYPFNVHQWKDAAKMVLDEKWNLISLPLVPFDKDIDVLLESLDAEALDGDAVADLIAIWYYDQCKDVAEDLKWSMYEGGGLEEMADGASYWVRMSYPMTASYNWWVWGTARAMPPDSPSAYAMCPGWNMFGFTSLVDITSGAYLWNFGGGAPELPYPLIYGWQNTGDWATSGWLLVTPPADSMFVGQGYWGYFPTGGTVVPP